MWTEFFRVKRSKYEELQKRIEELEDWSISVCNKLGDQIVKRDETIEQLEFRDKQSREDMVTMAAVNSTLYAKIEQLQATLRSTRGALRVYAPSNVFAQEKDDG